MAEFKTRGIPSGWTPEVQREMNDFNYGSASKKLARELVDAHAQIAALKQEVEMLKSYQFNYEHATKIDRENYEAELTTLRAKLEAMGRPVTTKEAREAGLPGECADPDLVNAIQSIFTKRSGIASQPNPPEQE